MADPIFENRRLAAIYDALDTDRRDLDAYVAVVDEFSARSVLDIGCGTGTFACLLANRGIRVIGVDPASASLDVARAKPGGELVRWILGDAAGLPSVSVDIVTMTGNVAQVFLTDDDLAATLRGAHAALTPSGRLVFETRDPDRRAWLDWTPERSRARTNIPGVGDVESWVDLIDVRGELVSFRWTYVFAADGAVLMSDSTLRFRERDGVVDALSSTGFVLESVGDAPDRSGRELVFLARPESDGNSVTCRVRPGSAFKSVWVRRLKSTKRVTRGQVGVLRAAKQTVRGLAFYASFTLRETHSLTVFSRAS